MKQFPLLRIIIFLGICLLLCACAAPVKKISAPQDPKTMYDKAVLLENSGNIQDASQIYISVWKLFPHHDLAPQALYRAGSLLSASNPGKTVELYRAFLASYAHSPLKPKVAGGLLETEIGLGKHSESFDLFVELAAENHGPELMQPGIKLVRELSAAKKYGESLKLIGMVFPYVDKPSQDSLLPLWKTGVENTNQIDQLVKLEESVHDARLLDVLLARQVDLYLMQGQKDVARRIISRLGPGKGLPQWTEGSSPQGRKTVGVLVPLSGKWESVGQKALKGIQFASRVFSADSSPQVEYLIRDYGNDEQAIPGIIEELDTREDIVALIGPVGETAGNIACREARKRGIPSFIFTRADVVSNQVSYCFSNFISIDVQTEALLRAAADMKISRFAILYPTDHFGNSFTRSFTERADKFGISVVRKTGYSSDLVDFKGAVQKLVQHLPQNAPPDFDALLIPDTAINAAMVASYLPYLNIKGVRLFGPTLWDTPDFIRVGGRYVENAVFVSGFFANSRLEYVQEFNDQFYYTFGYNPSVWEASAYDTATILQNLMSGSPASREALHGLIGALQDYPGLTGATSFYPDGSVKKMIYVLNVKDSAVYEIAP
jgi:ABC-type branched-subunit amino acid transport system substrate-binding protein